MRLLITVMKSETRNSLFITVHINSMLYAYFVCVNVREYVCECAVCRCSHSWVLSYCYMLLRVRDALSHGLQEKLTDLWYVAVL